MPPDDGVPDGYVAVGRVLGAWGIKGDFKIEPLGPDNLFRKGSEVQLSGEPHAIERSRRTGRLVYLKLAGIDDRDIAAAFRGQYLLIPEAELADPGEGQYFRFKLLGLQVVTTEGESLGEIADIFSTASNDVFVVRGERGEILVPAIEDIVQSIDVEGGRVVIEVVPGLLP